MSVDIATLDIRVKTDSLKQGADQLGRFEQQGRKAETATQRLERETTNLMGAVRGMVAAFAGWKATQYVKDAVLLAARYETLGIVMKVAGANAGYTATQMVQYEQALRKTGISMVESRQIISQMSAANLDLARSTDLARAAQNLAVVAQTDSSDAFGRMIHAIVSGETEILKTMGLVVSFEAAYKAAGKELTEYEKLLVRQNAVLQKAAMYNGIYEASMLTASKQLGSMTRYLKDFATMVGSVGLETLTRSVFGVTGGFKEMNEYLAAMVESGQMAAWGQSLADGLEKVANGAIVAAKAVGLFWGASTVASIANSAIVLVQTMRVQMALLGMEIRAAGGAWTFFGAQASVAGKATLTSLMSIRGVLLSISSILSGIMIGKYLTDNFLWANKAALAMGETIKTSLVEIEYGFKSLGAIIKDTFDDALTWASNRFADFLDSVSQGLANVPGAGYASENLGLRASAIRANNQGGGASNLEAVQRERDSELLTIRMTYLKRSLEVEKRFQKDVTSAESELQRILDQIKADMPGGGGGEGATSKGNWMTDEEIRKHSWTIDPRDRQKVIDDAFADYQKQLEQQEAQNLELITEFADKHRAVVLGETEYKLQQIDRQAEAYRQAGADEVAVAQWAAQEKLKVSQEWSAGAILGLREYADSATNAAYNAQSALTNAFQGAEDALVKFAQTGKLEFKDLVDSIIADIARMSIRQSITGPLASMLSGVIGNLGSDPVSTTAGNATVSRTDAAAWGVEMHTGGIVGTHGTPRLAPSSLFANAPRYHNGLAPDEFPAILQKGEAVIPKGQVGASSQSQQSQQPITIQVSINALDARSMVELMRSNPQAVIGPIMDALQRGDRGLISTMQGAVNG